MKKTFDEAVGRCSVDRSLYPSDRAFMEAQVRSLENECRALRETLRDKFAGQAMAALIADLHADMSFSAAVAAVSECAYIYADVMLEARAR